MLNGVSGMVGETAVVTTPQGEFTFDFLVLSTGLITDVALRPELDAVRDDIALWSDRYRPPAGQENPLLDQHPYLGPGFEFIGRTPQGAERLHGLYAFNYSALASLGLTLGAAGAISFLVEAITNPVGTAGAVADIGLGIEETAASTLANILGINIGGAGD